MKDMNFSSEDIILKINKCYKDLTATSKKLADFITANYDEVIFLSASDLAGKIETSEAAIVRFAQALGYKGFPEFKRELVKYYKEQTTPARKVKYYLEDLPGSSNFYDNIVEKEIISLRESIKTVDNSDLSKAIKVISSAKHRYIYAGGVNSDLAHYLAYRLNRFKLKSSAETYAGKAVFEKMIHFTKEDVVINYAFYQPNREHKALMHYLHKNSIPNILITDSRVPPMVMNADLVLYARRGPFGTFHSLIVPMAVTNAIIIGVADNLGSSAISALQELSDLRRAYLYEPLKSFDTQN
jgi:DNA-binding MurR/RpiR family transcriptional regulator